MNSETIRPAGNGPLRGIRVLELGQLIAGPFCGQILGDLGAEVVKVEDPKNGDPMRQWGQSRIKGSSLWWSVLARNKKSVTLDLRTPEGQAAARQLAQSADIVVENFRPGSMEKWGLSYPDLAAENPRLIMLRVSGFGQTGPYSKQAGYGSIGEAMGGLRYIVGDPSTPPSRVGISIGDSLAALFGTIGVLAALQERHQSGRGQIVDSAIYEAVLGMMESMVPEWADDGIQRERSGSTLPKIAPSNVYPTKDERWLIIAANQDTVFRRLAEAMGKPDLPDSPEFATHTARGERQAELDEMIAQFSLQFNADELQTLLNHHSVPVGKIFRVEDMLNDPQYLARNSVVEVESKDYGKVTMQNAFPRMSRTDTSVRWVGPELGQDTDSVLSELGYDGASINRLRDQGVIR